MSRSLEVFTAIECFPGPADDIVEISYPCHVHLPVDCDYAGAPGRPWRRATRT
jgi:hypothetical protein